MSMPSAGDQARYKKAPRRKRLPMAPAARQREAVLYVRVSSKEQEESGYSIPAQLKAGRDYAEREGLPVVREFVEAQSAKKAGRAQFDEMLNFLKHAGRPMAVITEKTDRLYRNFKDLVKLDDLVNIDDIELHLYKEGMVISQHSTGHEKLIHSIKIVLAKGYIDNLREETIKGSREKAAQGHYPNKAPLGYINNPITRHIDPDPERAGLVRRIFECYATGEFSIRDLVAMAREQGLPTRAEGRGRVTHTTINEMLRNPFYVGKFRWAGQMYDGKHTPLVSHELFARVQAIMDGRAGGTFQAKEFAFTGLLRCGYCGYMVTAEEKRKKSGKTYVYYHCSGSTNKDKSRPRCPKPHVREEALAERLGEIVARIQLDDRVFRSLRDALKSSAVEQQQFHEEAVSRLQAKAAKLQRQLKTLYMDKLDGNLSPDDYMAFKQDIEADLARANEQLAAHQTADRKYIEHGVQLLELAQTAYSSYMSRTGPEKRRLLNFVLSNCVMTAEGLIPTYRKPFDILASAGSMTEKGQGPDASDRDLVSLSTPNGARTRVTTLKGWCPNH